MRSLAVFIGPETDVEGCTLFTLRIQVLYCTYVLGRNWTVKVKQKAMLFFQRYLPLLEMVFIFFFDVTELLVSSVAHPAYGTPSLPR